MIIRKIRFFAAIALVGMCSHLLAMLERRSINDLAGTVTVNEGVLDLSGQSLGSLDGLDDLLRSPAARGMTHLDLGGNSISRLTRGSLTHLPPSCKEVNLSNNQISEVEDGVFDGRQTGMTVHAPKVFSKSLDRLRAQVEREQSWPRACIRRGAQGLQFLSSPTGTALWSIPLCLGLAYKYGDTTWWKALNVIFNIWNAKKAIQNRRWSDLAMFTTDSLYQFDVGYHVDNYMLLKKGISLKPLANRSLYQWVYGLAGGQFLIEALIKALSGHEIDSSKWLWISTILSVPSMALPSNQLNIKLRMLKLVPFVLRLVAQREMVIKPLFARLHARLSGWLGRTQNHVSTDSVGKIGECQVCFERKTLSLFCGNNDHACDSCIESWHKKVAENAAESEVTCPVCRGKEVLQPVVRKENVGFWKKFFNSRASAPWPAQ